MRPRAVALSSLAASALVPVLQALVPDEGLRAFYRWEVIAVKVAAAIGCAAAVRAFDPGDYLRRAWGFLLANSALLVLNDVIVGASSHVAGNQPVGTPAQDFVRGAILVAANVTAVLGIARFARAASVAGLPLPGRAPSRWAALALMFVLACALAGADIADAVPGALALHPRAIGYLFAALGDVAVLTLLAPLIATVALLRGGALFWPFLCLAASSFAWLLFDATDVASRFASIDPRALRAAEETCRAAGCLLMGAAGWVQVSVLPRAER